jgi:hypothetical protein
MKRSRLGVSEVGQILMVLPGRQKKPVWASRTMGVRAKEQLRMNHTLSFSCLLNKRLVCPQLSPSAAALVMGGGRELEEAS